MSAPAKRPRETPARRKIRKALQALGYEPREIVWNGPWCPIDFGADGGFSVDGFGAFASADEFVEWVRYPDRFAAFQLMVSARPASPTAPDAESLAQRFHEPLWRAERALEAFAARIAPPAQDDDASRGEAA